MRTTRWEDEREFWNRVYGCWSEPEGSFEQVNPVDHWCFLNSLVLNLSPRRVLSLAGGVDTRAVFLARRGITVVMVDLSEVACERTERFRIEAGLSSEQLRVINRPWEELEFDAEFDLVISEDAIHHLEWPTCLEKVERALTSGGTFLASEPICLLAWVQWFHRRFPFHPEFQQTRFEVLLGHAELQAIQRRFSSVEFTYFELFNRPAIAYFLKRWELPRVRQAVRQLDWHLMRQIPLFRSLAYRAVVQARKRVE